MADEESQLLRREGRPTRLHQQWYVSLMILSAVGVVAIMMCVSPSPTLKRAHRQGTTEHVLGDGQGTTERAKRKLGPLTPPFEVSMNAYLSANLLRRTLTMCADPDCERPVGSFTQYWTWFYFQGSVMNQRGEVNMTVQETDRLFKYRYEIGGRHA